MKTFVALVILGLAGLAQAKEESLPAARVGAKATANAPAATTRTAAAAKTENAKASPDAESNWAKDPYATPLFRGARPLVISR